MARYREIASALRQQIKTGKYNEHQALPDQETMAAEFQTSRVTIRKALQVLIDEGLIYTKQGSGTYVHQQQPDNANQQPPQPTAQKTNQQPQVKPKKILRFDIRFPKPAECQALQLKDNDPVYDIQRIRYDDKQAVSIETAVLPYKIVTGLDSEIIKGSIYRYIRENLGLQIYSSKLSVVAAKATDFEAKVFHIAVDEPILEGNEQVFLADGTPFELAKIRYPYTSGEITTTINKTL